MIGFLNTDGGARGNPGPAAIGIVLKDKDKNILKTLGLCLGETTNNIAEYKALIEGINIAKEEKITQLNCLLDSELVVKQLNGQYKVRDEKLKELYQKIRELEKQFVNVTYTHIRRELNKEADALVNKVLDASI